MKVVRLQVDRIINSTDPSYIDNQIEEYLFIHNAKKDSETTLPSDKR